MLSSIKMDDDSNGMVMRSRTPLREMKFTSSVIKKIKAFFFAKLFAFLFGFDRMVLIERTKSSRFPRSSSIKCI